MYKIEDTFSLVDEVLAEAADAAGGLLTGYRNHVYRMLNFTFAFGDFTGPDRDKIVIAAVFHDLGIWPGDNFDYLAPSIDKAAEFLNANARSEWSGEIAAMIGEHHKIRNFRTSPIVEAFRKGDLVDFSLGLFRHGLPRTFVSEVRSAFPNSGFHTYLVRTAARWACRHPFNPVPVLKW